MSYGIWDRPKKTEQREYFEKSIRRNGLGEWDARWHALSIEARKAFLDSVKGPKNPEVSYATSPNVGANLFTPETLAELVSAGFVTVVPSRAKNKPGRVDAVEGVYDFATRVRHLRNFHLLRSDLPLVIEPYIETNSYQSDVSAMTLRVLKSIDLTISGSPLIFLRRYVISHRWPGWVLGMLKSRTAEQIVKTLRSADGPILLADLRGRIADESPGDVRASFDKLIGYLTVFEDLDPKTLDIVVGLLPAVRADMARADQPRVRPPLQSCDSPKEPGPESGIIVDDLRAFLIEVATEPPRLRQDGEIFAKDLDRFYEGLVPLPEWIVTTYDFPNDERHAETFCWADFLEFVKEVVEGKSPMLRLTAKGEAWLASSIDAQYSSIIERLRSPMKLDDFYDPTNRFLVVGVDAYTASEASDVRFLASPFASIKTSKRKILSYRDAKVEDRHALREAIYLALSTMSPGVYYTLESLLDHLSTGPDNPLLLGRSAEEVMIYRSSELLPKLEEEREVAAKDLLNRLIVERLFPLGAFQVAHDEAGKILFARTPLFDAYFGRKLAENALAARPAAESRVVVQPDFSVIIIGLNPAPAAALAPFCDRQKRGATPGAMILKLTRESVIRAVANGLKPTELVARLKKFASVDIPPNVLKEVETWGNRVRHVTPSTLTVLRCPDRETADRVVSALKRGSERITDTLVSIDLIKLTSVERNKLKENGIILKPSTDPVKKPKVKAKTKRKQWHDDY